MAESLFTVTADGRYLPTEYSRGPWSPDALHGGPVAALCALAGETALADSGRSARVPVRLTLDLERPVPLAPLTVAAAIVRPGNKVQVAEITVHDDTGRRLIRATVSAIRRAPVRLPVTATTPEPSPPPPPPTDGVPGPDWSTTRNGPSLVYYHRDATRHQFVRGAFATPGPATDWIRLVVPVVPDAPVSPFQRVAAAADFVNGVSATLPVPDWTFINPDLTVTVHRLPIGEWVAVEATTRLDSDGVGTAEANLYDERGRLGRAVQTLLIEPRG